VILSSSNPGDLVLDPFFGTGTTGAVAKRLQRRWIGIERESKYASLARDRIEDVEADLFAESTFAFPSRRGRPRVAFGRIVEAGLVKPDQMLYFGGKNAIRAKVRANGAIAHDGFEGSIHQVGRKITNAPCNGWEHWYYEDSQGERRPINDLREIYLRMQIAG